MASFRLELRLNNAVTNKAELATWPNSQQNPDFLVATSGHVRLTLDNQIISLDKDANLLALGKDSAEGWLPDYLGGFALNLANAVRAARQELKVTNAKFIEEPVALRFERDTKDTTGAADDTLKITLTADGRTIKQAEVPLALALVEIGRSLQDFLVQLLTVNPRLYDHPEIKNLRQQIIRIIS